MGTLTIIKDHERIATFDFDDYTSINSPGIIGDIVTGGDVEIYLDQPLTLPDHD